jgi:predicted nucleic acid-binding protein
VKGRCVVDASAAAAILFRELDGEAVGRHLFKIAGLIVPQLFELEVANVARTKVLRNELGWAAVRSCLAELGSWPMAVEMVTWGQAWELARETDLTLYDAAYLWLARSRRLSLLTLDRALQMAAGSRSLL